MCSRRDPASDALLAAEAHRLSNALAVIASLLAYRRSQLSDPVAREQIEWAEQIVETVMLQTPPEDGDVRIDFRGYLARQAAALRRICEPKAIGLEIEADEVAVPPGLQVALALFVNELVMNAARHAFGDRAGGRIRIRLRRIGEHAAELAVADDGVGLRLDSAATGAGLKLLAKLARQMGGSLSFEAAGGTTARLRFAID